MSFSTYEFIFLFFPAILLFYYIAGRMDKKYKYSLQTAILIGGSVLFIGSAGAYAILCISVSVVFNYFFLYLIRVHSGKCVLYIGIIFNIVFLGYFKYSDFLIDNINGLFQISLNMRRVLLPLGISFYTFQQILILVEYSKSEKIKWSFAEYISSIVFFPKVISGPIISYQAMEEYHENKTRESDGKRISAGIYLFCIGLFKKIVIADTLVCFVDNGYGIGENINFWQAWCTSLCYTLQIYFDFSGYSDMAIGIAATLGFELPINFDSPYQAKSIAEFWRKWHITLSKALSKLIYIPMGGNRQGKVRTYVNLMVTFLVSGLWHGASWTFVLWGGLHGLFMVVEKMGQKWIERLPDFMRKIGTFVIVNFLWILFRAGSLEKAVQIYHGMFQLPEDFESIRTLAVLADDGIIPFPDLLWAIYVLGFMLLTIFLVLQKKNSNDLFKEFVPNNKTMLVTIIVFVISVLHLSRLAGFVYVNF